MPQLNMHVSDEFNAALRQFMRIRGIKSKSEAIRQAVFEGLKRSYDESIPCDFESFFGAALEAPVNPKPRFKSDDDLWS